jgi:hypothetical protein
MEDETGAEGESHRDSGRADSRAPARSAEEVLMSELPGRAGGASPKLRELLTGTILISIESLKKHYRIDWSQPQLKVEIVTTPAAADCTISLNEDNFLRVANGDLNPQIAMLARKIRVEGKKDLAMYFFNLFAPKHF